MATGDKELTIRVVLDGQGVVDGLQQLANEMESTKKSAATASEGLDKTEKVLSVLSKSVYIAKEAFNVLSGVASAAIEAISKGAAISDVAQAFENLSNQAGITSDVFLNKLNVATGQTIANFDLQKKAIEAVRSGAKPDEFLALAEAARALAEQTGGETKDELDELTRAFQTGRTMAIEAKLGQIDVTKAEQDLAAQLGITSAELSEEGKKQAARTAILEQARAKTAELGTITADAGDNIQMMGKTLEDAKNKFFQALAENQKLNEALANLATALANVDFGPIIDQVGQFITDFQRGIEVINDFWVELEEKFNPGLKELNKQLDEQKKRTDATTKAVEKLRQKHAQEQRELDELFDLTGKYNKEVKKTTDNLVDHEKVSKRTTEATNKFNAELEKQKELFERLNSADGIKEYAGKVEGVFDLYHDGIISTDKFNEEIGKLQEAFTKGGGSAEQFAQILEHEVIESLLKSGEAAGKAADDITSVGEDFVSALFGFGSGDLSGTAKSLAGQVGDLLNQTLAYVADGLKNGKFDLQQGVVLAGSILGTIFGGIYGGGAGAAAGGALGAAVGQLAYTIGEVVHNAFNSETAGTKARKAADRFFADAFDKDRLLIIINGQLKEITDLVFEGDTPFGGKVDFGAAETGFFNLFDSMSEKAKSAFGSIGLAFAALLGDIEHLGGTLGAVFANNIGTSLNNLQLLIQATGISADQLKEAIVQAFLDGSISAIEAQTALNNIKNVMEEGIPDGVGLVVEAFENLKAAGEKGGRAAIDALKDLGAEAKELGAHTLQELFNKLQASGKFTAEEIQKLQEALKKFGIDTLDELSGLSNETAIAILSALQADNFPFAEVQDEIDSVKEGLDQIPGTTRRNIIFDVKLNMTSSDRDILARSQITLPGQTGPGLGR